MSTCTRSTVAFTSATLHEDILEFERRHAKSSADFLTEWRSGDLDHGEPEWVEWESLLDAYRRSRRLEGAVR